MKTNQPLEEKLHTAFLRGIAHWAWDILFLSFWSFDTHMLLYHTHTSSLWTKENILETLPWKALNSGYSLSSAIPYFSLQVRDVDPRRMPNPPNKKPKTPSTLEQHECEKTYHREMTVGGSCLGSPTRDKLVAVDEWSKSFNFTGLSSLGKKV